MEEFQVHHANGGRYVERGVLRCVVGNVDTSTLDTGIRGSRLGKAERLLIVGMDSILLHGHVDMDVMLCDRHEVTVGRQKRTSYVLSRLCLGASCYSHLIRADHPIHSGCRVSFYKYQAVSLHMA